MRECSKIMLCGAYQLALFAGVDTGGGTAKFLAAAHAHFSEHQRFVILQNQINLAEAAAVVAGKQF